MPRRKPTHAGSWYEDEPAILGRKIDVWLDAVPSVSTSSARAIIGPHAGFRYCGHVMAHAYKAIDVSSISRVFLLGPSHHFYSKRCHLSAAEVYDTPLGPLEIDQEVCAALRATGHFDALDIEADEAEHSLELHTPFIARVMHGRAFKLVPIVVGSLTTDSEATYGRILGPYLDEPSNLIIASSDFCHWGTRFSYTFVNQDGPIWKSIKWLDELGIEAIKTGKPEPFAEYLQKYKNTICGRHPIGVLLNMLGHCRARHKVDFHSYDQSSRAETLSDSSVSYAAGVITLAD